MEFAGSTHLVYKYYVPLQLSDSSVSWSSWDDFLYHTLNIADFWAQIDYATTYKGYLKGPDYFFYSHNLFNPFCLARFDKNLLQFFSGTRRNRVWYQQSYQSQRLHRVTHSRTNSPTLYHRWNSARHQVWAKNTEWNQSRWVVPDCRSSQQ